MRPHVFITQFQQVSTQVSFQLYFHPHLYTEFLKTFPDTILYPRILQRSLSFRCIYLRETNKHNAIITPKKIPYCDKISSQCSNFPTCLINVILQLVSIRPAKDCTLHLICVAMSLQCLNLWASLLSLFISPLFIETR